MLFRLLNIMKRIIIEKDNDENYIDHKRQRQMSFDLNKENLNIFYSRIILSSYIFLFEYLRDQY